MEPRPTGWVWSRRMKGTGVRTATTRRRLAPAEGTARRPNRSATVRSETTLLAAILGAMIGVGLAWVALLLAAFEVWSTW